MVVIMIMIMMINIKNDNDKTVIMIKNNSMRAFGRIFLFGRSEGAMVAGRCFGRGGEMVGNPHRAQISQFELFELILLLKLDKRFPVEQFEASRAIRGSSISVSSTLPPLRYYHPDLFDKLAGIALSGWSL